MYAKSLDGTANAPNFRLDDGARRLNANDVSNDWNEHNRFVFVRNSISFPAVVFVKTTAGFSSHSA